MERIEFCGGIGAGKSTCASALTERWTLPLVAERFDEIPYWNLYYEDPACYALEKDLSFLISHAESIRRARAPLLVCDFSMSQTVAYSAITGDIGDTRAVAAVYERMTSRLGVPRLVFRLRCDTEVQLQRIRDRGRAPEAGITADYLKRLDHAIDERIAGLPPGTQVIELDTTGRIAPDVIDAPAVAAAMDVMLGSLPRS